jgi:hypothetical protein
VTLDWRPGETSPRVGRPSIQQRGLSSFDKSGPIADRQFDIEFLDSGVEAFAFTFG